MRKLIFSTVLFFGFAFSANALNTDFSESATNEDVIIESCEDYAQTATDAEISTMPFGGFFASNSTITNTYNYWLGYCDGQGGADNLLQPVFIEG
jgi:hypothetical protein